MEIIEQPSNIIVVGNFIPTEDFQSNPKFDEGLDARGQNLEVKLGSTQHIAFKTTQPQEAINRFS